MTTTDTALRAALRLYPARYRRERGDELAAVFADTTADAGRFSTARELFDLAAYGLRVRLGVTSSSTAGRVAALAAPYAVGAAMAWPLVNVVRFLSVADPLYLLFARPWFILATALVIGAALLGMSRWWVPARGMVFVAAVVELVERLLHLRQGWSSSESRTFDIVITLYALGPLLWGVLLLAAPPELLKQRSRTRPLAVVGALLVAVGVVDGPRLLLGTWRSYTGLWEALFLCLALSAVIAAGRGRWLPAAMTLAALPLVVEFAIFTLPGLAHHSRNLALTISLSVAVLVLMVKMWRAPEAGGQLPPAAG